jgi:predicted anti-sigma-YlaC factor YlaD
MIASVARRLSAPLVLSGALMIAFSGCSLETWAVRQVSNLLTGDGSTADAGTVFTGEEDPELVAQSLPFTMKLHESLLAVDTENAGLYLATGRLFATYANAFVQGPAEELPNTEFAQRSSELARAKRLYLRAREFVLTGLELLHPGSRAGLLEGDLAATLATLDPTVADYVYWVAASWLGAFTADQFDFELILTLQRAAAMLEQVNAWDPVYDNGGVHEILISYYGGLPAELGGSKELAVSHFESATAASAGKKASPYLALATALAVPNQDREQFRDLLETALAIELDIDAYRLINVLGQRHAAWLLAHEEDYFL